MLDTKEKFERKLNDPTFLYHSVKVCDLCYENLKDSSALDTTADQYLNEISKKSSDIDAQNKFKT